MSKLTRGEYKARNAFKKSAYVLILECLERGALNSSEMCEKIQHSSVVKKLLEQFPDLKEQTGIGPSGAIDKRPRWFAIIRSDLDYGKPGYKLMIENGFNPVGKTNARKWVKAQEDTTPTLDAILKVEEPTKSSKKVMTECEKILKCAEDLVKLAPNDKIFANCLKHAKQVYGE